MNNSKNKVKFNLCNVHYAPITVAEDGTVTFAAPVAMPGAVSISLNPTGEPKSFYADGIEYYVINNNQGYDGDLELAMIPESFRSDVLMEVADSNNVLVENANSETGSFALLFEFDGDARKIRHVLYNCSASRPSIASKTNEENKEVQTEKLTIKARPLASGYVKAKTGDKTDVSTYNGWYERVYMPGTTPADVTLSALSIGSLTLVPPFDEDVVAYTASTSNATNTVTAAATDRNASVAITVNGEEVDSGDSVTWESGTNNVLIRVASGSASRQYAVTVMKS